MRTLVTVSNALVCAILDGIPVGEAQRRELVEGAGLAESAVRDITARTSILRLARLWRRVLRVTGDELIGLVIGNTVRGDRFGLGATAAVHGETFRDVLVRFAKYASLVNDLLECTLVEDAATARFATRLHWNVLGLERHAVDITFSAIARFAETDVGAVLPMRELRLKHSIASSERRYRERFAAPITFGANRNELVFDASFLDRRVEAHNPDLGILLDRYASQELVRVPVVTDLPARVRQIVRRCIEDGTAIELAAIAEQLETTPRSLQRKLRDHATSVSLLVDDVRRALAPELLAADAANVEQVGFRLGYSEPTAFIRAFKKWYGTTPGAFRRARTSG